jgi:1-acyl-sn-glycerol-3-phosphate acyltransferase
MKGLLRWLFFVLIVRPLALIVIGLNVRHRERLPKAGPALIVANHNSHLDTLVLISLFPLHQLPHIRPVAAVDYFLRNRLLAWFALNLIGIVPLQREIKASAGDPLAAASAALEQGAILILFPEGSRGEPERLSRFKSGVAHLAKRHPAVPVIPIFLHGLGKSLPKGEALLVPFFCDVFVGEAMPWNGDKQAWMSALDGAMQALASEGKFAAWE